MKRMSDQVLILAAISEVRNELKIEMNILETVDVMTRLSTLYALLDVRMIGNVVEIADTREQHNGRKVA